ncbi:hypothetical protein HMPREF9318_01916 [Streptococcus urinalis FB127-CNA-2]|uniref:ABM domain-containing protein n=1 Tax=Streptococcus urinalis 2285-97 TaxID=764291 RepID=G5KDB8_9STRE|nr:hypothetical protein [Streptococcus urinalis]EHJ55638.1 hypothetical protein STRUR_1866 [Streptococcus urinalis 2285-97]EKS17467.1 hypothetical protein HMPREF9318_01916 [Streptococcus urinalis FB127-CNA-2]VEF32711.1 Uncharacterised protein [Streptococcus urinalis]
MIRVDFLYRVKTINKEQLLAKFAESADPKFDSQLTNTKIEMAFLEHNDYTDISLNIYYQTIEDYQERTAFERSQADWNAIWFQENDVFELVSTKVYQLA